MNIDEINRMPNLSKNNQILQNVIMLFDEQGTPTFRDDRETDNFLGVSVSYYEYDEDEIFHKSDLLFGLSNKNPVKNTRIGNSHTIEISELVLELPISIVITYIDLSNKKLQGTVSLFEKFGTEMRRIHRSIRGKPIAQILYTQILNNSNMLSIKNFIELFPSNTNFSIYIDDWSFPEMDLSNETIVRSQLLNRNINSIFHELMFQMRINVETINILSQDCNRKRFIDVLTSVISRGYIDVNNKKYNYESLNNILNHPKNCNKAFDITQPTIEFLEKFMDSSIKNR